MTNYGNFSYKIYKGKIGQKWPKMTIKWLKMVQLTPNLAIFCICGTFMNFPNFGKIGPFLGDFWPKTAFFMLNRQKLKNGKLTHKVYRSLQFWPKLSNLFYKWSLIHLKEKTACVGLYFEFLWFYGSRKLPKRHFLAVLAKKRPIGNFRVP